MFIAHSPYFFYSKIILNLLLSFILTYCSIFYNLLEYIFLILNKSYPALLNNSNIINSTAEDFLPQYIGKNFEYHYT